MLPTCRSLLSLLLALPACTDDAKRVFIPTEQSDAAATAGEAGAPSADAGAVARRCALFSPTRLPFFGDLHVHTALSLDANLQGTRLRPADAYRFARGERVDLPPYDASGRAQRTVQLARPLDFVAVSDHAEFLGLVTTCVTPGLAGYDSPECTAYRTQPASSFLNFNAYLGAQQGNARLPAPCTGDNAYCGSAARAAWEETRQAAARAQDATDACAFTSFVAYEWSASPATQNLHRNVIFRSESVPELPFSYFDGNQEEQLWDALERDCQSAAGCDVLTIPHNSNLSAGLMFEPVDREGRPFDRAYAERRARMEPLVEVFQHKGSSECLPALGSDEQCGFELIPYNTLGTATIAGMPGIQQPNDTLLPRDYVRHALGQGLLLSRSLGANPFAYGFIGSTDTHVGTPGAVDEREFVGHGGAGQSARDGRPAGLVDTPFFNPGGLAVLWAEENSRDALFAAMKRREAYATSGTRITLRFFGGFDLPADSCGAPDFAQAGYARGVAMGGVLEGARRAAGSGAPRFALSALRDPGTPRTPGMPLDRVQIVKGWLAGDEVKYAIFDVATGSGDAAVDPTTCELKGSGSDELCGTWTDPSFDPTQPAFYYARVLERPSCRWHVHACLAAGVNCADAATVKVGFEECCGALPKLQAERAWSSPIFYQPG